MNTTREAVIKALQNCTHGEELICNLNALITSHGKNTCKVILDVLTHMDFEPQTAEHCWEEIVSHHSQLSQSLQRIVSLPVAVCDYFCKIKKTPIFPILIDVHKLEEIFCRVRFDFLTGLYNRQALEAAIFNEIARAKRYSRKLSLLFLDLDSFKALNDTYGHIAGDRVLQGIGSILGKSIRQEDVAARYGGEEFVVLLPDTDKKDAMILADRIRTRVEKLAVPFDGRDLRLTVSGGVATFPDDAETAQGLIRCADHVLYKAKRRGKNLILPHETDNRQFVRINFEQPISIDSIDTKEPSPFQAKGRNISCGGILLEYPISFDIGAQVAIRMPVEEEKICIRGMIVRKTQIDEGGYVLGVAFAERQESVKNVLGSYVWKFLKKRNLSCRGTQKYCHTEETDSRCLGELPRPAFLSEP